MDALMRNDWPEDNSGVRTAFKFSMPAKVEEMLAGQVTEYDPIFLLYNSSIFSYH
jgi:hypothetical protein